MKGTLRERLDAKTRRAENGCIEFIASRRPDGYGQMFVNHRCVRAYRVAWELAGRELPTPPLQLDHICRNRACVNVDHLRVVTPRGNMLNSDSPAAINARKDECVRGHPLSGDNVMTRRSGGRICRACNRDDVAHYSRAHRDKVRERQNRWCARKRMERAEVDRRMQQTELFG